MLGDGKDREQGGWNPGASRSNVFFEICTTQVVWRTDVVEGSRSLIKVNSYQSFDLRTALRTKEVTSRSHHKQGGRGETAVTEIGGRRMFYGIYSELSSQRG